MESSEESLPGGNVNDVVRVGDTVRRTTGAWTPTIHALLAWVRAHGVDRVPVPYGLDGQGREVLSYLPGEVGGWPVPAWVWEPAVLEDAARLLRSWHDATAGFPRDGALWRQPVREPAEVVCLNDVAPYNMVHDDGRLVGLIDVDMASPGPRAWDLGYLAYRMCGYCQDMPAPDGVAPGIRLDRLLTAYGAADLGIGSTDVLHAARDKLLDLAAWTDQHAQATSRPELHGHAEMYRHDAARLPST